MTTPLPKSSSPSWKLLKKSVLICLIASWLVIPELLWHKSALVLHLIYESLAFLLEILLIHSLGMEKFYAQMTVFYVSSAMALGALYLIWRRLPHWLRRLKARISAFGASLKQKALTTWFEFSLLQKTKFLLFQFAGIASGLMLLLA